MSSKVQSVTLSNKLKKSLEESYHRHSCGRCSATLRWGRTKISYMLTDFKVPCELIGQWYHRERKHLIIRIPIGSVQYHVILCTGCKARRHNPRILPRIRYRNRNLQVIPSTQDKQIQIRHGGINEPSDIVRLSSIDGISGSWMEKVSFVKISSLWSL